MQSGSPYSAGPRLTDAPHGDPAAQAVASLRGYAYQLYASAIAWLDLKSGQELYLEVAKDYALVAGDALKAVEVKDTSATRVTLNSPDIRQTLNAFVDLAERNPQREVRLRFLSTSTIGKERKNDHRVGGEAALLYWRRAAAGADVTPLRNVLAKIDLTHRVQSLIQSYSDDDFRERFLKRIHWDCGSAPLGELSEELVDWR